MGQAPWYHIIRTECPRLRLAARQALPGAVEQCRAMSSNVEHVIGQGFSRLAV